MFAAHKAQINVERSEPTDLNLDMAQEIVRKRNASYCEDVVLKNLLKKPKNEKKSQRKILKAWEMDEQLKMVNGFTMLWNHWRKFYIGSRSYYKEWEPNNRAQLTVIGKIVSDVETHDLDLGLYIACTFKAWEFRHFPPTVQICLSNGLDYYNEFISAVMADIGENDYLEGALL